jgi:hypothetical protein
VCTIFIRGKHPKALDWLMMENVAEMMAWLPTTVASVAMIRTGQNTLSEKKERGTKRDSGKLEGKVDVISFSYIKKQISYMYMTLTSGCWLELPAPNFFSFTQTSPYPPTQVRLAYFSSISGKFLFCYGMI